MNEFVNWLIHLVMAWTVNFIGGFDGLIKAMLIFMFVEYITGIICVIMKKSSFSKVGIKEFFKKVFMLMMVGIANTIDIYITNSSGVFRTCIILFYVSYIGKSILKNAKLMEVTIPSKLKKVIKEICNDEGDNVRDKKEKD